MDSIDLSGFRWLVPKDGFELRKERESGDLFLYQRPAKGGGMTPMGEGGMATVYLAKDLKHEQRVGLKERA